MSAPGWDTGLVSDESDVRYPTAVVDGFELGMFVSYNDCGDAWVNAPDATRWGTYAVQLPMPLTNDGEAARYLAALLPELRPRWEVTAGE